MHREKEKPPAERTDDGVVRQRLTFRGQVQGVGFRYRAKNAAHELGLTGWAGNMWDGSVVVEAQGTQEQITQLISRINEGKWIRIDSLTREHMPVRPDEMDFRIHYT